MIQFAGLGSGLPIDSWITELTSIRKNSTVVPLEADKKTLENSSSALKTIKTSFTTLQSKLKALQKNTLGNDVWESSSVTSSMSDYVSAKSTSSALNTTTSVKILQLATGTVAKSNGNIGKLADQNTEFGNLGNGIAQEGSFTFYVDNNKFSINIAKDDTLDDIAGKIKDASGSLATAKTNADGTFEISVAKGTRLSLGGSSDTSNFKTVMHLNSALEGAVYNTSKSGYPVTQTKTTAAITSTDAGFSEQITQGSIKINGQKFDIDEKTSLNDLIRSINTNKDAKVSASYDSLSNKLILTSTATGEYNIALEQEGTNLLEAMGLMDGSSIAEGSQTLGQNAKAIVNGNEVVSSSNTLTSSVTGVSGLTINLLKKPEKDESVDLKVTTDNLPAKKAMQEFVDAYNTVVNQVNDATQKDGYLEMDTNLRRVSDSLRSIATSISDNEGSFNMLAKMGVTTSATDGNLEAETRTLKIDSVKLNEAFDEDFSSVQRLLTSPDSTGLVDKLFSEVNDVLNAETGYFKIKDDTLTKQIKYADQKLTAATASLETYKAQLTRQFQQMDKMIAKLNNQYSSFSGSKTGFS